MNSLFESSSNVAIVTGASKGYGRAVCRVLIDAGWSVVGNARDETKLRATAIELTEGPALRFLAGDVLDEAHLLSLIDNAREIGKLRLVVNNASTLGPTPLPALERLEIADLLSLVRMNTAAPLRLVQLALPFLKKDSGRVINLTSDAALESYEGWGGYGASKLALEKITSVLAAELPEIRFYSLDPGDMQTDMHQAAFPGEDISDRATPDESAPAVLKLAEGDLPSGRYRAMDLLN